MSTSTGARVSATPPASASSTMGQALLSFAQRLAKRQDGWLAVHVHLSRLRSATRRRSDQIKLAVNAFRQDTKPYGGLLFDLESLDLVFVWSGVPADTVGVAVDQLRLMFDDDPIGLDDDFDAPDLFATWYHLDTQHAEFLAAMTVAVNGRRTRRTAPPQEMLGMAPSQGKRPLEPDDLDGVVKALSNADVSNLVRNQPICALIGNRPPEAVYFERYVAIGDLEAMLTPHLSLTSDPWLFQYLTKSLDRRMIINLRRELDIGSKAIALNLNVSTLLGDDFRRLDSDHGLTLRGRLVVEVQITDLFANVALFEFARGQLAERGYRICLDGVSYLALPLMNRAKLGLDLVKVTWEPAMADMDAVERAEVQDFVKQSGAGRVILTRCGDELAVRTGQELGISLFQGRHVDHLLRESRPAGERLGSLRVG